jgi:hypothetical protein
MKGTLPLLYERPDLVESPRDRRRFVSSEPIVTPQVGPEVQGGNWSIVPRVDGEILTAQKYNLDRQAVIDNQVPLMTDDYSYSVGQMQAQTSPGTVGGESQATSLAGELERLRYALAQVKGTTYWYEPFNPATAPVVYNNNVGLRWKDTGGAPQVMLYLGTNNWFYIGTQLAAGARVVLYRQAELVEGATIAKGAFLNWDDIQGIAVDGSNNVLIGNNAASVVLQRQTTLNNGPLTITNGGISTTGDVTVGTSGIGQVLAKNTAKAWARVTTNPYSGTVYNIPSAVWQSVGVIRFTLAQSANGPVAVATAEYGDNYCVASSVSGTVIDVALRSRATGAAVEGTFSVVFF